MAVNSVPQIKNLTIVRRHVDVDEPELLVVYNKRYDSIGLLAYEHGIVLEYRKCYYRTWTGEQKHLELESSALLNTDYTIIGIY